MARLYIGNLPRQTAEHELQAWIEGHGFKVETVQVIRDLDTTKEESLLAAPCTDDFVAAARCLFECFSGPDRDRPWRVTDESGVLKGSGRNRNCGTTRAQHAGNRILSEFQLAAPCSILHH